MKDRVPGAPGQYKAVISEAELQKMQTGEQFTITMTRDDQPIVEGTPYSKAAVLPDDVAKLICPDVGDPTPADALLALQRQKAPAGYGLGTSGAWVDDLNKAINSGFYCWTNVALNRPFDYGSLLVLRRQGAQADRITQIGFNALMIGGGEDANKSGAIVIRHCNYVENSWSEWEWVNPPMVPGEEYRTIERYNGNVVYAKAIDCGEWPSGISGKSIAHNILNCRPFEAAGRLTNSVYTVPYTSTNGEELKIGANSANINFFSGFEIASPGNLIATLKYYKV